MWERENTRREKILQREEALETRRRIGGESEGPPQEKIEPKVPTDTEYAEALERGEVNPLKEDGFIK